MEVLIDLRGLGGAGGDDGTVKLLREGAAALPGARLIGLIDRERAPLPEAARACLHDVRLDPYAAGLGRPACFVQLAPCDRDPLFTARLLQAGMPAVRLQAPASPGLAGAVARYWRARAGPAVPAGSLWGAVAARVANPPRAERGRVAVLAAVLDGPLPDRLRARGATLFTPPITRFSTLSARYDRVLYVLGNTPADAALLPALRRGGGAVLLTESCLLAAYRRDPARAVRLAAAELGRAPTEAEWRGWTDGIIRTPALLLREVVAAATPLLVHSTALAAEIETRYGKRALVVPAPTGASRPPAVPGTVEAHAAGLGAESCVWALELLRFWGLPIRLSLLCPAPEQPRLRALAAQLGVTASLSFGREPGAEILLFSAMRGGASYTAALADAVGAGRRCIASPAILEAIDAPFPVISIPDQPSAPLLAAAIRTALQSPPPPAPPRADAASAILQALDLPA